MKKISCLLILVSWLSNGYCQDNKARLLQEFHALSERYMGTSMLSFDIIYKYSREDKPGFYLDSLQGSFKMNGSEYWYRLDSTEAISDKDYCVLLFKADKIMYLVPPGKMTGINPLSMLDSLLLNNIISGDITETKSEKKIILTFPAQSKCRKVELDIDKNSGFINRTINIVKGSELYDPSIKNLLEDDTSYAIVETSFMNYAEKSFDEKLLNSSRYFKKENNQYVAVAPYESYEIFLSTPNL